MPTTKEVDENRSPSKVLFTYGVDAVEVVRCKDCKWFHCYKTEIWCEKEEGLNHPKYDSFCSYGERKEDAKTN